MWKQWSTYGLPLCFEQLKAAVLKCQYRLAQAYDDYVAYTTQFRTNHAYISVGRCQIYKAWIPFKGMIHMRLVKICQLIKHLLGVGWHTELPKSLYFLKKKLAKPKTVSRFLFGKRHCGLEYGGSVQLSGAQTVFLAPTRVDEAFAGVPVVNLTWLWA